MNTHYEKHIYHSNNLYQIFTYVKNADTAKGGDVAGMLLYAKTDETVTPNSTCIISGNTISVRTLDLSQHFVGIRSQLEDIAISLKRFDLLPKNLDQMKS